MKVGIFGGTFNPPHYGHLIIAEHVREIAELSRIIFVPSYISPHKRAGEKIIARHRLEMVRLAVEKNLLFQVSDLEIMRKEVSYTYRTLEMFHETSPGTDLFFLIGLDNIKEFRTWKFPERIVQLADLLVMQRPSFSARIDQLPFASSARLVPVPEIQISSTDVRLRVRNGKSIRYLVPEAVESYIRRYRLYKK